MAKEITHKDNITGEILTNKITHEDNIQDFEEFDYLTDFYFPIKDVEERYSSPALKLMRENKIDPYELLETKKVEGVGPVIKIEDKKELEEAKVDYSKAFKDFLNDSLPAAGLATAEAGANITNNLVQLLGFTSNRVFKDTENENISQFTTELAQSYNKGTEDFVARLDEIAKEKDINGVSKLLSDIGIDISATFPIQKMLKKTGMPSYVATPLAFGLAYGFTSGDKDAEHLTFIDSEVINKTNELLGVLPDTPESEVAELVATTFEGTLWGVGGEALIKVFKVLKNNVPALMSKQGGKLISETTKGTAAGGVLAKSAYDTLNPNEQVNFSEEKKTPELGDQSAIPGTVNEYGFEKTAGLLPTVVKAVGKELVKKPIFTSKVVEAVKNIANKGSGNQVLGQIKNIPGVKQSEIKWIGLDDFLQNKKSVTKKEVSDFVNSNRIDVNETLRGGEFGERARRYSKEIENMVNTFENKWIARDPDAAMPVYDTYKVKIGADDKGTMDFSTLSMIIDTDVAAKSFQKMPNGLLRYKNVPDGTSVKSEDFFIHPLELEKYKIEGLKREFRSKNINQPKFEQQYTEAGGKDYTELVFSLKDRKRYPAEMLIQQPEVIANPQFKMKSAIDWTSPTAHFGKKNEIAHVRFKTRDLNGMKVLTVEEMQNDLLQAIQRGDVKGSAGDKITDFPFKNTWYELVTKRLIRYAADNGFDAVAIPKGSIIQDRYKLTRRVEDLNITFFDSKRKEVGLMARDQNAVTQIDDFYTFDRIEKEFGKDVLDKVLIKAKKLDDSIEEYPIVKLTKVIEIGGEGKTQLYNVAIPKFMKKYGKKWNAKVYDDTIEAKELLYKHGDMHKQMPVTIIKLTPEMKKAVQEGGQSLFEILGTLGASGVAAKALSDSQGNNTISK